jgi:CRISPR/Cas system CSM-associated protein Csm2 small subunit
MENIDDIEKTEGLYSEDINFEFTSIEHDLSKLDKTYDYTYDIRHMVISKLHTAINEMKFDIDNMPAKDIEAKMGVVNALSAQLNDIDKQQYNRIAIKSKIEAGENSNDYKKAVAEYLKRMSSKTTNSEYEIQDIEALDKILDDRLDEESIEILDGELKNDATDLK